MIEILIFIIGFGIGWNIGYIRQLILNKELVKDIDSRKSWMRTKLNG